MYLEVIKGTGTYWGTSKTHLHADGDGTGVVRDGGKWMGVEMGGDREGP